MARLARVLSPWAQRRPTYDDSLAGVAGPQFEAARSEGRALSVEAVIGDVLAGD